MKNIHLKTYQATVDYTKFKTANSIMKFPVPILFFSLICLNSSAQGIWKDTLKKTVDLKNFRLSNKVVKAEYGKVVMYFNQADYLGKSVKQDTVRITPKYFSDVTISKLLKKGRAKILRRSDSLFETAITHYLKQYGSMCDRIFELRNGVCFFSKTEIFGLLDDLTWEIKDTSNIKQKDTVIQVKDFAYPEEFADHSDTTNIKIKDYFPSKPSFHYVYNDNNGYGELDTNICKTAKLNKRSVFYFAECYAKYGIVAIGTTMFGSGIYYYQNDSLFVINADYEKDIKEKDLRDAALLIPAAIKTGDSSVFKSSMEDEEYAEITLLKKEDLNIGKITHKDCIKLKIKEYSPYTVYISYVWLKKEFGLVKWMRSTGLVEELVNSF